MNPSHELASLRQRIAKAERSRDAWRAAGMAGEEHYLEACTTISALTLQLDKLHQALPSPPAPLPGPSAEGGAGPGQTRARCNPNAPIHA